MERNSNQVQESMSNGMRTEAGLSILAEPTRNQSSDPCIYRAAKDKLRYVEEKLGLTVRISHYRQ